MVMVMLPEMDEPAMSMPEKGRIKLSERPFAGLKAGFGTKLTLSTDGLVLR